jgi:hypothetical protein
MSKESRQLKTPSVSIILDGSVHFPPVGHTHEDIDQQFNRVSVYMHRHDAPCDVALLECCKRSFLNYGQPPVAKA